LIVALHTLVQDKKYLRSFARKEAFFHFMDLRQALKSLGTPCSLQFVKDTLVTRPNSDNIKANPYNQLQRFFCFLLLSLTTPRRQKKTMRFRARGVRITADRGLWLIGARHALIQKNFVEKYLRSFERNKAYFHFIELCIALKSFGVVCSMQYVNALLKKTSVMLEGAPTVQCNKLANTLQDASLWKVRLVHSCKSTSTT
jgi:hypothetical protein